MTDILTAVNNYLLKYLKVEQAILYRGYQQMTLPATQDYIVYYLDSSKRIGTNVDESIDNGTAQTEKTHALMEYVVTVDINNIDNDAALDRAINLSTLGRSYFSTEFFEAQGIEYLYADDFQYLPFEDEHEQYNHRYRIKLHLSAWADVTQDYQYFDKAKAYLENVDVAHKPTEKE